MVLRYPNNILLEDIIVGYGLTIGRKFCKFRTPANFVSFGHPRKELCNQIYCGTGYIKLAMNKKSKDMTLVVCLVHICSFISPFFLRLIVSLTNSYGCPLDDDGGCSTVQPVKKIVNDMFY
jgi:hypothetical protein